MGGKSSQQQQSSQIQNTTTAPWAPTQGLLQNIIGSIGGQNTAVTPQQQQAVSGLQSSVSGLPDYTGLATGLVNNLSSGTPNFGGGVSDALSQYQKALTPFAQGQNLDPTQAPGMASVLDTIRNDVGNSVNGLFAGAGRDLSGANTQTLARGIAQGEAQPLLNQYQQNQGIQQNAISNLYNGGILGANTLSGLYQTGLGNQLTGLATAQQVPGVAAQNPTAQLQAAGTAQQLPLSNIGNLLNLILPIAGLGGQQTGVSQGNTVGSQQMSGAQQFATIAGGLGNLGKLFFG